ncbi:sulfatase-like hydrolase/transferase [Devosia beringensis]|uniref:sulfatase-like hydrolase/transferase n=1 Tax=Devosia beringensis TaxID=2657486 RepID=UPI00186BAA39|nr:sulfatase-like hydrolase/transferase [Devosia beringensis]
MNIITIAVDDMNAFATFKSLYPGVLHTPNIDRLMAEGVTFQNAFAQVALCNPSRTSILTGKDPALTGVHYNTQPWFEYVTPQDTVPAMIKAAGYNTAIYGKVFHLPLAMMDQEDVSVLCDVYSLSNDYWTSNGDGIDETSIGSFPVFGALEVNVEQHGISSTPVPP